jgi:hypothetical protein
VTLFKMLRIGALLTVLIIVAASTWLTERRLATWERPVWVTFYPLAADSGSDTARYVNDIDEDTFSQIDDFFKSQSVRFGIDITPVINIQVAPVSTDLPPEIPDRHAPHLVAWWSLKMRWYAWNMDRKDGLVGPDIQVFALFHGNDATAEKHMSVGMRKGLYGVVNLFASKSMNSRNQVVIAHELMHVFGATDKYSLGSNEPLYPQGYSDPRQKPLFPQTRCEIMGGRIPLTAYQSVMPRSLEQCTIGELSAREIGFFDKLIE